METLTDFIFLDSKITADGDCSDEIKSFLFLERKAMTSLDSILKCSNFILLTKVLLVQVMVFPVVIYECESWTKKKAECQRIDAFELWCWIDGIPYIWNLKRNDRNELTYKTERDSHT